VKRRELVGCFGVQVEAGTRYDLHQCSSDQTNPRLNALALLHTKNGGANEENYADECSNQCKKEALFRLVQDITVVP
jgi:hypothetical protein